MAGGGRRGDAGRPVLAPGPRRAGQRALGTFPPSPILLPQTLTQKQSVLQICKCNRPGNPDEVLIGCSNPACKRWLHQDCITKAAVARTFARLGTDTPHVTEPKVEDSQTQTDDA